jgi:hypothetical protein
MKLFAAMLCYLFLAQTAGMLTFLFILWPSGHHGWGFIVGIIWSLIFAPYYWMMLDWVHDPLG